MVTVENVSGATLNDVVVGYYFDWDIGFESDSNTITFFPEAIPSFFVEVPVTAMLARYASDSDFPVFGCGVISNNQDYEVQGAAQNYSKWKSSLAYRISTLNSNTSLNFDGIDDISCVVGMKFPGTMQPGEKGEFILIFGAAMTKQELAFLMMEGFTTLDVKENSEPQNSLSIYPMPASDYVQVEISNTAPGKAHVIIKSVLGGNILIESENILSNGTTILHLDTSNLSTGAYILQAIVSEKVYTEKIIIIK